MAISVAERFSTDAEKTRGEYESMESQDVVGRHRRWGLEEQR
jgi:hypothetical protein